LFISQSEAIPESLKNMLLVMSTAGIFHDDDAEASTTTADRNYTALWQVTWERIDCFLPNLKRDLFLNRPRTSSPTTAAVEEKSGGEQEDKNPVAVESSEETITITVEQEQETQGKLTELYIYLDRTRIQKEKWREFPTNVWVVNF
jgi:hypothetical protein